MKSLDREGVVTGRCDKETEMTSNLSSLIGVLGNDLQDAKIGRGTCPLGQSAS